MIEPPADGEYWVVIRVEGGERAVAHATQVGLDLQWVLLDELAEASDVIPVFKVALMPVPLRVWEWYVVVDPATRQRSTARLIPLTPFQDGKLGWDVAELADAVPQNACYPLWPLHSL